MLVHCEFYALLRLGHHGQWTLLYRASSHGFSAKVFHSHCDNYGPTLTIVKVAWSLLQIDDAIDLDVFFFSFFFFFQATSGHIFGGFTDVSWNCRNKRGKYSSSHK